MQTDVILYALAILATLSVIATAAQDAVSDVIAPYEVGRVCGYHHSGARVLHAERFYIDARTGRLACDAEI